MSDKPIDIFDYKDFAIRAAKELKYPEGTIDKIKLAKSDGEIARIMKTAREACLKDS